MRPLQAGGLANDLPTSPMTIPSDNDVVLIVDDDEVTRDSLAELVALDGFVAATAPDGVEALEYLRHAQPPCVIILDLTMPKMDGWQFRAEQKKDSALAGIPVIVTTARSSAEASTMEADAIFLKPLDVRLFLDVISHYR